MDKNKKTRLPVGMLIPLCMALILMIPFFVAIAPILLVQTTGLKLLWIALAPITGSLSFLLVAGILSRPFHKAIVSGKFPRELTHSVYGPRRLYALCWCSVIYSGPLYYAYTSVPFLKSLMLRLFGYKGSLDMVLAPDAWVRDLPLLNISAKTYVANKATLGTNMCLQDGTVFVDKITMGNRAMVGHMCMIGPGARLLEGSEVGVGSAIGIRTSLRENSKVGICCMINHGAILGINSQVGNHSYIGLRAEIAEGVQVPAGANIPAGASINSEEDLKSFITSETQLLKEAKNKWASVLEFDGIANG